VAGSNGVARLAMAASGVVVVVVLRRSIEGFDHCLIVVKGDLRKVNYGWFSTTSLWLFVDAFPVPDSGLPDINIIDAEPA
jgi:hypothetical protein